MSTRPAPRPAGARPAGPGLSRRRVWWIAGALLGVAVLVVITAVVASSGGSKKLEAIQVRDVTVKGTTLPTFVNGSPDPALGAPAPRVDGKSIFGSALSIKPGRPTLLIFLNNWCTACDAELGALVQWHHAHLAPEALDVVSVSSQPDASKPNYPPSSWLVIKEWPWVVMADSAAASAMKAFGFADAAALPGFVLIDADGSVRWRAEGAVPIDDLVAALTSIGV